MKKTKTLLLTIFLSLGAVTSWELLALLPKLKLSLQGNEEKTGSIVDREGRLLNLSFVDQWNSQAQPLSAFPPQLREMLIFSEDKNFYSHLGVDILAKFRAVLINLKNISWQQGGSTLTEQVARIRLKSKRTVWNRWLQIFSAFYLEFRYSKNQILTFYLNQVPFAENRRGFFQAAELYFGRDLSTLTDLEMVSLVYMLRAPSGYDVRKYPHLKQRVLKLSSKMGRSISDLPWEPQVYKNSESLSSYALLKKIQNLSDKRLVESTIDRDLQREAYRVLKSQLQAHRSKGAQHAALLIVDHRQGEVLSYVSLNGNSDGPGIDVVQTPRQPASTLKPFVYAAYLERGGSSSDLISDSPVDSVLSGGLHSVQNYSRSFYGNLSIREALANSLNTPAVKMAKQVGVKNLHHLLQKAGLNLPRVANFYGEGLALGNPEVSLWDLTSAYTCLANRGQCLALRIIRSQEPTPRPRLFKETTADRILDILSDPHAREREFGFFQFSHQVALKTGTSTDYRDAWTFGMNSRYLIGVWVGNLNASPMQEITGAKISLPIVRTLLHHERLSRKATEFALSSKLHKKDYCFPVEEGCEQRVDLFLEEEILPQKRNPATQFQLLPDTSLLHLALDPRLPEEKQVFHFKVKGNKGRVQWLERDRLLQEGNSFKWKLKKGHHLFKVLDEASKQERQIKVVVHSPL